MSLSRDRNTPAGILRVTGRDVAEGEYAITNADGAWTLDGQALADAARKAQQDRAVDGLGDNSAKIVQLVNEHPEGIGPTAVAASFDGMTPSNATTYLQRLERSGRISKKSRGLYIPPVTSVGSVTFDGSDLPNVTHVTHVTPPTQCTACAFPLNPSVIADGFTTHPAC